MKAGSYQKRLKRLPSSRRRLGVVRTLPAAYQLLSTILLAMRKTNMRKLSGLVWIERVFGGGVLNIELLGGV